MIDTSFNTKYWNEELFEMGSILLIKLTAVANCAWIWLLCDQQLPPPLHTQHPAKWIIFSLIQLSCLEIGVLLDAGAVSLESFTTWSDILLILIQLWILVEGKQGVFFMTTLVASHLLIYYFSVCYLYINLENFSFILLLLFIISL